MYNSVCLFYLGWGPAVCSKSNFIIWGLALHSWKIFSLPLGTISFFHFLLFISVSFLNYLYVDTQIFTGVLPPLFPWYILNLNFLISHIALSLCCSLYLYLLSFSWYFWFTPYIWIFSDFLLYLSFKGFTPISDIWVSENVIFFLICLIYSLYLYLFLIFLLYFEF